MAEWSTLIGTSQGPAGGTAAQEGHGEGLVGDASPDARRSIRTPPRRRDARRREDRSQGHPRSTVAMQVRWAAVSYLPSMLFLCVTVVVREVAGVDFALISRDQMQQVRHLTLEDSQTMPFWALMGMQSTLGGLLWFSGATVCLLTAAVLWSRGPVRRRLSRYLAALGVLSLWLGTDDIFMIHDELAPRLISVLEGPFTAIYVTSIAAVLVGFRHTIRDHDPLLLFLALALLGGSVGVDLFQERLGDHEYRLFAEDGFKFLGITGMFSYHLRQAWRTLADSTDAGPPTHPG